MVESSRTLDGLKTKQAWEKRGGATTGLDQGRNQRNRGGATRNDSQRNQGRFMGAQIAMRHYFEEFVGEVVQRYFEGHGVFKGKVMEVWTVKGCIYFHILYEDGNR
jgi:membrane protein involved in colicin uptake